jgi:hypothetical protein
VPRNAQQALEDAALGVAEPHRENALQHPELEVRVPLHGELIVRQLLDDGAELPQHLLLVDGLQQGLVLGRHEGADRREGRRQADLEAARDGNHAVALEPGEDTVGRQRRVGVAERAEGHAVRPGAVGEADAGQGAPALRAGRHDLELPLGGEDGQLPDDPVRAGPRLPIGDPAQAFPERIRDGAEHGLRAGQRHAADQVNAGRGQIRKGRDHPQGSDYSILRR